MMPVTDREPQERGGPVGSHGDVTMGLVSAEPHVHAFAALDRGVKERDGVLPVGGGTADPCEPDAAILDRRYL